MNTLELVVPGMTCGHCESAVRAEVSRVDGVDHLDVDLATKVVVVHGTALDRETIVAAIDEAGYDVA